MCAASIRRQAIHRRRARRRRRRERRDAAGIVDRLRQGRPEGFDLPERAGCSTTV